MRSERDQEPLEVGATATSRADGALVSYSGLVVRGSFGGVLMGLANLVPGISGGTMLLVTGVYPAFVRAVAELSTLRFRIPSLIVLATVSLSAVLAIGLLAGSIKDLVVMHAWLAYSLFIGLTLGGVPVLWRMIGGAGRSVWYGAGSGFLVMAALAWMQQAGAFAQAGADSSVLLLGLAGVGGAAAMVLPGISGGYILLVLGQYIPILSAVEDLRAALGAGDFQAVMDTTLQVLLPVGLGILVGIVVVSNLVKMALERARRATLGVLLGLLCGAVLGLWPFRAPAQPVAGQKLGGEILTEAAIAEMTIESWPTEAFTPSPGQAAVALLLVALGLAVTTSVAWLGSRLEKKPAGAGGQGDAS